LKLSTASLLNRGGAFRITFSLATKCLLYARGEVLEFYRLVRIRGFERPTVQIGNFLPLLHRQSEVQAGEHLGGDLDVPARSPARSHAESGQ
jgi:hypothetical protein